MQVCPSKLLTSEMVEQVAEGSTHIVLVSVLPPRSVMPATLVCKRLRQRVKDARIYIGLWGETMLDERRRKRFERVQADTIFTSLTQAEREIMAQAVAAHPQIESQSEEGGMRLPRPHDPCKTRWFLSRSRDTGNTPLHGQSFDPGAAGGILLKHED